MSSSVSTIVNNPADSMGSQLNIQADKISQSHSGQPSGIISTGVESFVQHGPIPAVVNVDSQAVPNISGGMQIANSTPVIFAPITRRPRIEAENNKMPGYFQSLAVNYEECARNFELAGDIGSAKNMRRQAADMCLIRAKNYEREKFFQDAARYYYSAAVNLELAGDTAWASDVWNNAAEKLALAGNLDETNNIWNNAAQKLALAGDTAGASNIFGLLAKMWEKVAKDSEKGSPSERVFIYYNNAARNFELAGNADKAKEIRRKVANGRRIQAKNYEREKFFQDAAKHYDNAAVNFEFAGDADRAKEMRRKVADAWKIQAENFEKDRKYQLAGKYYNLAFVFFKQSMNTHEAGAAQEKAFLCFKKLDQHAIEKAKNNLQIISHCNSSSAAFALCNENMEILGNFGDLLQIIDTCCTTADALCKKNNLTREELTMCATSHEKAAEYCCEINWHDRAVIEWTAAAEIFEKLGDHVSVIACYTKIVEACKNIGNTKKIEAMEKKLEENRANFQNKAKTIYDNAQPMVGSTTAPLTIGSAQIDANAPSTTDGAQIGTAATNDPQAPTIRGRLKFKNSK